MEQKFRKINSKESMSSYLNLIDIFECFKKLTLVEIVDRYAERIYNAAIIGILIGIIIGLIINLTFFII
jgi:ABC-type transport system involved in cytochrome c biogenesis permease subunit